MFLNTGVWVVGSQVGLYYFKYILGNADFYSLFFFYMLPANIVAVVLTPFLTQRLGKLRTFIIGSAVVSLTGIIRHFLPIDGLVLFVIISMIGSAGQMFCSITQWGMVPDTVEYGQWKTGVRSEGIPFAFFSFTQKAGMAVAGSLAAFVLSRAGYEANTDLTDSAMTAIRWLFNMIPAFFSAGCLVALLFYKLDGKKFRQIMTELEEHRRS
jgi:Na+/melibiose symporter-like transporter